MTKRDILRQFCNLLWSEESSHSNAILQIAVSVRRTTHLVFVAEASKFSFLVIAVLRF